MSAPRRNRVQINGAWVGTSEDCALECIWVYDPHFNSPEISKPKVVAVESVVGLSTGADYTHQVNVHGDLLDHLSECILEIQEM